MNSYISGLSSITLPFTIISMLLPTEQSIKSEFKRFDKFRYHNNIQNDAFIKFRLIIFGIVGLLFLGVSTNSDISRI